MSTASSTLSAWKPTRKRCGAPPLAREDAERSSDVILAISARKQSVPAALHRVAAAPGTEKNPRFPEQLLHIAVAAGEAVVNSQTVWVMIFVADTCSL